MRFPWGTDSHRFVSDYWQRTPLFCPAALDDVPLPDWVALAATDNAEVRCIAGDDSHGYQQIEIATGRPVSLPAPDCPWTVLVQNADLLEPRLAELRQRFSFVPRWRLEDIMLSYAVAGGSVGPHSDAYDVFLVQAAGERRWQVASSDAELRRAGSEALRLVEPFQPTLEVIAQPGDVLYLPPGVAHHGVAGSDCITLSVGFRSPALAEVLAAVIEQLDDTQRYRDPAQGFLTGMTLGDAEARPLQSQLAALVTPERVARALACVATEVKPWLLPPPPESEVLTLPAAVPVHLHAAARLLLIEAPYLPGVAANGEYFPLAEADRDAVRALASHYRLSADQQRTLAASATGIELLSILAGDGLLTPERQP